MTVDTHVAVVLAAGAGRRLGADKALIDLGGRSAISRVVEASRRAGFDVVRVVRQRGAAELPQGIPAQVVVVESAAMIESLRGGLASHGTAASVLVWPIDHSLATAATVSALRARLAQGGPSIVLPVCADRPGHPILLAGAPLGEVLADDVTSLRDVIRRDPSRVASVAVEDCWVLRDIDTPADLRAARGYLAGIGIDVTTAMRRHRSRRDFAPDEVSDSQLRWVVDSARFASTSSFIQSYSVVVVREPARRRRIAELCADQDHIRSAPVFLAVCADLHRIARSCERHRKPFRPDSLEVFVEATVDASLFGQNIQLAAESEGLGACMIGAARNAPCELAALLELPRHVYVVFGMALGWPVDDPVPRGRLPLAAVLHDERYDSGSVDAHLDAADEAMRAWARRCNARSPSERAINEQRGWTDRMAWLFGRPGAPKGRERLAQHLRSLGFGLELDIGDDATSAGT